MSVACCEQHPRPCCAQKSGTLRCSNGRGAPKRLYDCTDADCKYVRARAEKSEGSRWEKVLQKNKDKKKDKKKEDK